MKKIFPSETFYMKKVSIQTAKNFQRYKRKTIRINNPAASGRGINYPSFPRSVDREVSIDSDPYFGRLDSGSTDYRNDKRGR